MLNKGSMSNVFDSIMWNGDNRSYFDEETGQAFSLTKDDFALIEIAMFQELMVVLAKNKYLQGAINEKFETNPSKYYESYLLEFKDMFQRRREMLDIPSEDAFNKLVGIVSVEGLHKSSIDESDFRIQLIKKGYRDIYRCVKNMTSFNIFNVFERYSKKQKNKKFSKRELADIAIISYAVAICEELSIEPLSCKYLASLCHSSLIAQMTYDKAYLDGDKKNRIYDVIPKMLLDVKKINSMGKAIHKISSDSIEDAIMADSMEYYSEYLNSIGLDIETFASDIPYTKEDIEILTTFLNHDDSYILSEDSKKAIFSALIVMLLFKKKYDEAKNIVLNRNAETRFHDALKYEENIKRKELEIETKVESYTSEIDSLKKQLADREEEIKELRNQVKKQQDIIDKSNNNYKELLSLRKAIYSINNTEDEDLDYQYNDKKELDNRKDSIINDKIVIFGGGPRWVSMLKKELPNYIYFDVDDINRDISCMKKSRRVYINTQKLSHAFYKKIVSESEKYNVDIEYIINLDKISIINQIYNDKNNKK